MRKYINILALAAGLLTLVSCNDFLDRLPDDRADLNTLEKVRSFLVSAYPVQSTNFILEYSSDNYKSNGKLYAATSYQDKLYRWEDVEDVTPNDCPRSVWRAHYEAVATANQALDALDKLESGTLNNALRAEALLCRAYGMLQLANVFCMSWNPEKADEYLGLPYPKVPGVSVDERGTLRQLFENINQDIEDALPLLNDGHLNVPKYHFNTKAAYAFAARFNLYYNNLEKAVEYSTRVLGPQPESLLRNFSKYKGLAGMRDIGNAYVKDDANLMCITNYSLMGRASMGTGSMVKYAHNRDITMYETHWAKMPWGSGSQQTTLYQASLLYGTNNNVYIPKLIEMFEVTDKVSQTGFPHTVDPVFTTDETLLVRAEAYARQKDIPNALNDINLWIQNHCAPESAKGDVTRPVMTEESLNKFWDELPEVPAEIKTTKERGIKKPLHPQGFTVESGTQTNLLYMILQMRRLETIYQGHRFIDIKRYGIEFSHDLDDEPTIVFKAGDLRGAIQLPVDVITAGLAPNPRENK